jgi:hypothetical protein
VSANLITPDDTFLQPRYTIRRQGQDIWLPNALVDGAADEPTPVSRIRQSQDMMALRLFVELYAEQNLREDGGVSPFVVYGHFERERLGERGQWAIWRFSETCEFTYPNHPVIAPHFPPLKSKNAKLDGSAFWNRFQILSKSLGLLECVPYLFEGPKGEPIHAMAEYSSLPEERALFAACTDAAARCMTDWQLDRLAEEGGFAVPVKRHIGEVTVIGIYRLRYRPHTKLTAAWYADHLARCHDFAAGYNTIAANKETTQERRAS